MHRDSPTSSDQKSTELPSDRKIISQPASSKSRKNLKSKESNVLSLENVLGITSNSTNSMALNKTSGEIAYPAGSMIVIYNSITNKQTKFITSPNKRSFSCLTYSKDGKFLIAGEGTCKNPEINVWDMRNDNPPISLKGHKFGIQVLLFSPDNRYLVSIGDDNDKGLFVWDWEKETKLSLNKLSKKINTAKFNAKGTLLVTAGNQHLKFWPFQEDGTIILVKPKDSKDSDSGFIIEGEGALLGSKFKNKNFTDVSILDNQIFALDSEGILCVLNENRKVEKWMDLKVSSANSLQITNDYIVCGCSDGVIRFFKSSNLHHLTTLQKPPALGLYNVEKSKIVAPVITSSKDVFADCLVLLLDEQRNRLITFYSDRTLFIWDISSLDKIKLARSFLNHNGTIHDIQTLDNSSYEVTFFATGSIDQTVRIWNLLDVEENKKDESNIYLPSSLRRNLYSKNLTRILYLCDTYQHFKNSNIIEQEIPKQVRCLKCSHDGQYLAIGDQDGTLRIFSLINFNQIKEITSHNQEILCIGFTPENPFNSFFLATGSRDRMIHIYNGNKEFNVMMSLDDHKSSISGLQFAYSKIRNSILLISCGVDKTLIFREYKGNSENKVFLQYNMEIDKTSKFLSIDLNHENNIIVLGQEKKIQYWSLEDGKLKNIIETKEEDKYTGKIVYLDNLRVAIDSSGTYIAISNNDKIVRIRDFTTGNIVAKANCGDITTSLAFTFNSKQLITVTAKGCIYMWRLSQEIKGNIEKKKQQLGRLGKKIKEILGASKDLTLNSFWIEQELKSHIQKNEDKTMDQLLNELNSEEKEIKKNPFKKKKEGKNIDIKVEIKENIIKNEEKCHIDPSELVDKFMLPSWAQTKEETLVQEKKDEIKKIDVSFEEIEINKDNWISPSNQEIEEEIKGESYIRPKETIEVQNEEIDQFIKENYIEIDKIDTEKSPLRTSLTNRFWQEHSSNKKDINKELFDKNEIDDQISNINQKLKEAEEHSIQKKKEIFDKNEIKDQILEINKKIQDIEEISIQKNDNKKDILEKINNENKALIQNETIFKDEESIIKSNENKNEILEKIEHKEKNKNDISKEIFDKSEIEDQMMLINKKLKEAEESLAFNYKVDPSLFESQMIEQKKEPIIYNQKNQLYENLGKPKNLNNIIDNNIMGFKNVELIEFDDSDKELDIKEERDIKKYPEDFIANIKNETIKHNLLEKNEIKKESPSKGIIEKNDNILNEENKKNLNNEKENIFEEKTESPLKNYKLDKKEIISEQKEFDSLSLSNKIDECFLRLTNEISNISEILKEIEKSDNTDKEKFIHKIEEKTDIVKNKMEKLIKKNNNNSLLKNIFEENSSIFANEQNKSLSHFIVDQSRDLLETYSIQLLNMIKQGLKN